MAGMVNADTTAVQLETVYPDVPVAYERDDTVISLIEKRGGEADVSSRAMRVSTQIRPGGAFRQTSFDNGDLGRGGASQYLVSTLTPVDLVFVVEISKKVEISTNNRKKALFDVINREMASMLKQCRTAIDILAVGPGSGILGTATTISGTTWTMATGATGVSWFYVGQHVELFTSNMATKRTGVAIVQTVDPEANQITVDALPTNGISGDVVAIEGLTQGAGLTQTIYGLAYHVSSANTGTWQTVNRANYPEVRAVELPAGGNALTLTMLRTLVNKVAMLLGVDFATGTGCTWLGHLIQKHAFEAIGQAMYMINNGGNANQTYSDIQQMVGIPAKWGIHCDPTVLDLLKLKSFGRAVSLPLAPYKVPGGGGETKFPIYGTSGGLQATMWTALATSFQIFNNLPRSNAYISGLTRRTDLGYIA